MKKNNLITLVERMINIPAGNVKDMLNLYPKNNIAEAERRYTEITNLLIAKRKYEELGENMMDYIEKPHNLANGLKNEFKKFRYFVIAMLIDWDAQAKAIADALKRDGYDKDTVHKLIEITCQTRQDWEQKLKEAIKEVNNMPIEEIAVTKTHPYSTKNEDLEPENNFTEDIEKHDTLNNKLFGADDMLRDEVREKILDITDHFVEDLEDDGVEIIIKDIVLIGSNASYNYTKDSDLDIHIIADTESLNCPQNLYPVLYGAYRSIFNKKFDIDFYGIPVEIYVETEDISTISNGIYSVKNNEWIKEPVQTDIPEIDMDTFYDSFDEWEQKFLELKDGIETDSIDTDTAMTRIMNMLEDIYNLRKESLANEGEYSIGNLIFKEFRNRGYLDELKELKDKTTSKQLSLESLREALTRRDLEDYKNQIWRAAQNQPIVYENGHFFIYNIKENEASWVVDRIRRLDFIKTVRSDASGKFDFSHINPFNLPARFYTISGQIKL